MKTYKGKCVFEGYSLNKLFVVNNFVEDTNNSFTSEKEEFSKFKNAREKAVENYKKLYESTLIKFGQKEADLFNSYVLMAEDLDFEDLVKEHISNKYTADAAVSKAIKQLSDMFLAMDDEYMRARSSDVIEVGTFIREIILGVSIVKDLNEPVILICDDISASNLLKFDLKFIRGIVLIKGNLFSHISIFARTLEIPTICAVENLKLRSDLNGKPAILDSIHDQLIIEPTDQLNDEFIQKARLYSNEIKKLKSFKGKKSMTKDGFTTKIYANIASVNEIENALKNDAEGIGLFRTEFLYLNSNDYPSEEKQFEVYKEVLSRMKGKEVVIRTLDIGADKKAEYFNLPKEENPALGYRSIRICRDRPEIFKTQLRALLRASVYGKLSIMIPMIISIEEVLYAKKIINIIKRELVSKKIPFDNGFKFGIMIETPAAALISDDLAKHVDFFSIGTNDLSQYTLACDRLNSMLITTFNPYHPAILKLIELTVKNAHKNNIPCGMCGEFARDPKVLDFLMKIHLDEISCTSAYILKVRSEIANIDSTK